MIMVTYLIRTALCLALFYLAYRLVLNQKCHYAFGRIYLIGGFVLSFFFPLITIDLPLITLHGNPSFTPAMPLTAGAIHPAGGMAEPVLRASEKTGWDVLLSLLPILYFTGILVFAIRYALGIFRLAGMIRRNHKQRFKDYTLVRTDQSGAPFSFFRYIFVSAHDLATGDFQSFILKHELAHIRAWHSLDRLFLGLGQIIQWFNPVTFFYKKSLIALHEMSADYAAVDHAGTLAGYQQKMMQYACEKNHLVLTSHFSNTLTKNRFIMMTRQHHGRWNTLRVFTAAVMAAFLLLAFSSGDKIRIISTEEDSPQPSSMEALGHIIKPVDTGIQDTLKAFRSDENESGQETEKTENEDISILSDELRGMKTQPEPDSLVLRFPHRPFSDQGCASPFMPGQKVDPAEQERIIAAFRRQMAEKEKDMAEFQRQMAEKEKDMAEFQRRMAGKEFHRLPLEQLKEMQLHCPDADHFKKMAEAQARIEAIKPMLDEWLERNAGPGPFGTNKNCIRPEHLQPMIKVYPEIFSMPHPDVVEPFRHLTEKDREILEKQKQWQEKYSREMKRQHRQMEDKQDQLMKEYKEMMKKYRAED